MNTGLKFKRKTLRQWAAFARRGGLKKTYDADHRLHVFEDEVILRKWRESGRPTISAKELAGLHPDLFNPKLLPRAMKRMARQSIIERDGRNPWSGRSYKLKGRRAARRAA